MRLVRGNSVEKFVKLLSNQWKCVSQFPAKLAFVTSSSSRAKRTNKENGMTFGDEFLWRDYDWKIQNNLRVNGKRGKRNGKEILIKWQHLIFSQMGRIIDWVFIDICYNRVLGCDEDW